MATWVWLITLLITLNNVYLSSSALFNFTSSNNTNVYPAPFIAQENTRTTTLQPFSASGSECYSSTCLVKRLHYIPHQPWNWNEISPNAETALFIREQVKLLYSDPSQTLNMHPIGDGDRKLDVSAAQLLFGHLPGSIGSSKLTEQTLALLAVSRLEARLIIFSSTLDHENRQDVDRILTQIFEGADGVPSLTGTITDKPGLMFILVLHKGQSSYLIDAIKTHIETDFSDPKTPIFIFKHDPVYTTACK